MNLRPSGYEPDELPGCSIPRHVLCPTASLLRACWSPFDYVVLVLPRFRNLLASVIVLRDILSVIFRFGDALLSHTLRCSTIGAKALNCRVREGTGCFALAMVTKPKNDRFPSLLGALPPGGLLERCTLLLKCMLLCRVRDFCVCLLLDQIKPIGPLVPVN